MPQGYLRREAVYSPCGLYRYKLVRVWIGKRPVFRWILLNPSTADATEDDSTVRRVVAFTKRLGGGGIEIYNLFAIRGTVPSIIKEVKFPIGKDNDDYLRGVRDTDGPIIAGWGIHGTFEGRDIRIMKIFRRRKAAQMMCLGLTNNDQPKHPLYLPYTSELRPYKIRKPKKLGRHPIIRRQPWEEDDE